MPGTRRQIAKILPGQETSTRVVIIERPDGYFVTQPQRWYRNIIEGHQIWEGWIPTSARSSIFETVEMAEKEACIDYPWLLPASQNLN